MLVQGNPEYLVHTYEIHINHIHWHRAQQTLVQEIVYIYVGEGFMVSRISLTKCKLGASFIICLNVMYASHVSPSQFQFDYSQ